MVIADLARSADLDRATVRNYLTYLDTVFLTTEVLSWSTNLTSRLSKTPEVFLTDTGLAAHLLGTSEADLSRVGHPAPFPVEDLVSADELTRLQRILARINPRAVQAVCRFGEVPLDEVLDTKRFDFDAASSAPGWLASLNREHGHDH